MPLQEEQSNSQQERYRDPFDDREVEEKKRKKQEQDYPCDGGTGMDEPAGGI
jgi:hypothetical protein